MHPKPLQMSYIRNQLNQLTTGEALAVEAKVTDLLKDNRYDPSTGSLVFSDIEVQSFENQIDFWKTYFSSPENNAGLQANLVSESC